jgi:phosphoribosyl-ATP pyrophosphohydrolase
MLTAQQYILTKIAEEANEVAQRALGAQQFGIEQTEPGKEQDNGERLESELLDLMFWIDIAIRNCVLAPMDKEAFTGHRRTKLPEAFKMLVLSLELGQLVPSDSIKL